MSLEDVREESCSTPPERLKATEDTRMMRRVEPPLQNTTTIIYPMVQNGTNMSRIVMKNQHRLNEQGVNSKNDESGQIFFFCFAIL